MFASFHGIVFSPVVNHRNAEWLRLKEGSAGHLVQHPCSAGDTLKPAAQDCVQAAFDCLQGGKLHHLPGQPVPVFPQKCSRPLIIFVALCWTLSSLSMSLM